MKRFKFAFTIAEVLITIGIIGIVAAMTIPNLIQSQYEKSTVAKLRKVNYNLQHSFQMIKGDDISLFVQPDVSELTRLLASHLKTSKVCYPPKASDCVKNFKYTELGGGNTAVDSEKTGAIVLIDGTVLLTAYNALFTYAQIFVDVNGEKLPNIMGKDMFSFFFVKGDYEEYFEPRGNANWKNEGYCRPKSKWNNSHNGLGCTKWVVQQGNMNYLH
jgi:type II secretory pathway pseudopilin PulG